MYAALSNQSLLCVTESLFSVFFTFLINPDTQKLSETSLLIEASVHAHANLM